ncbi:helix-turn-helix domain-containing protein [Microbispora bryophytorum]|uniref:helix-turn-helix domain-containing protein n=1 Tax=Microbispora bryophytorum TaxID=1460882 RepID=UPI00340A8E5D
MDRPRAEATGQATTRFRAWRLAKELSLDEVADLTGLSKAMLSRAERGQRELAPMTKVKVARRLGVAVRDLFEVSEVSA